MPINLLFIKFNSILVLLFLNTELIIPNNYVLFFLQQLFPKQY